MYRVHLGVVKNPETFLHHSGLLREVFQLSLTLRCKIDLSASSKLVAIILASGGQPWNDGDVLALWVEGERGHTARPGVGPGARGEDVL